MIPLSAEFCSRENLFEQMWEIFLADTNPGEMYVRCGGKRESGSADTVRIVGTHQDISDTVRLEKSKQAERRLAELNQRAPDLLCGYVPDGIKNASPA